MPLPSVVVWAAFFFFPLISLERLNSGKSDKKLQPVHAHTFAYLSVRRFESIGLPIAPRVSSLVVLVTFLCGVGRVFRLENGSERYTQRCTHFAFFYFLFR